FTKRRKHFCESDCEKGLILRKSFACRPVAQSLESYDRKATPPNSGRKQRQPHGHSLRNADAGRQGNEDEIERKQQPAAEVAQRAENWKQKDLQKHGDTGRERRERFRRHEQRTKMKYDSVFTYRCLSQAREIFPKKSSNDRGIKSRVRPVIDDPAKDLLSII